MKIYVASSWRNGQHAEVVERLREEGHEVYDFKNPRPGNHGFSWSEIDPNWRSWTAEQYIAALKHPIAIAGFCSDMDALASCDVCVLVLPCGRSAHLEAGFAAGAGKTLVILTRDGEEPELMARMGFVVRSLDEVVALCALPWNAIDLMARNCGRKA